MCQVIAITNQKGGVGKTTTTFHLGTKLAQEGKRVLLIDADPQASLTASFGIRDADTLNTTLTNALQAIVEDEPIDPGMGIRTHEEGAKLFPANIELASFETAMINVMSREYIMRELVSAYRPNFDYILIDCMQQDTPKPSGTPDTPDPSGTEEHSGTDEPAGTDEPGGEAVPPTPYAQTISLQKQFYGLYEWDDDRLLVQSEFSHVTLWQEDAAKYPGLAEMLEQTANMIKRSMEDEYDNLCATALEEPAGTGDGRERWVSTLDIQVRRADSVAISLLSDSRSDYGWIEDFRGMYGSNYDTQTGQELKLSDVVKDMESIPALVAQELDNHMWAGDFSYEGVVDDYFRNTPENGISWTLDYNGVTFYFADGDLTEPGNGRQTATISFAEYPELFEEKYMTVPAAYMVELPLDSSFFTDLDGEGDLEELNVTGWYNTDAGSYTKFGVYSDADGGYRYEDCFADGFLPYYVKTTDGNHYLYLFCEQGESSGPVPMMLLIVFDVCGGKLTRVGEMNAAPGFIPPNIYRVPTDPEQFFLDDFDAMAQDMMVYAVGPMGLPELK